MGMAAPAYRFHRSLTASGFTELELPDDVLAATRSGLPDLRILSASGEEIPYAIGGTIDSPPPRITLFDVEHTYQETTALADRGEDAPRSDSVDLAVSDVEFIKPVTVEASTDRATWSQIARGSIFATASGVRMTRLHFAPNDRRYWRFRFDDRNGAAVAVSQIAAGQAPAREPPARVIALEPKPEPDAAPATSTYSAVLPTKNLPLRALRVRATDAAFLRRVRVFERVWFRDEVSRRLLGEADIARRPGRPDELTVHLSEPAGQQLEIDVDRTGGVPLHGVTTEGLLAPRVLRFHAPEGAQLELVYGANTAPPPAYDLAAALKDGVPARFTTGKLGPATDTGVEAPPAPLVERGSVIGPKGFKIEQPIQLPAHGPIAYLDVDRGAGPLYDLRIVDQSGRQVPYIVETDPRHARIPLAHRVERVGNETVVHLDGLDPDKVIDAIELEIAAPDYFTRRASVVEATFDKRGATRPRPLGEMQLVKVAEKAPAPFHIDIESPTLSNISIHIADGDNAPLTVKSVAADITRRRVNFLFAEGDELRVLSGNHAASPPSYDLALIAARVLSAPAEPASLGQPHSIVNEHPKAPAWFWIFVFAAAVVLLLALARTLTTPPGNANPPGNTT
jgi:hypothetical protein